MKRFALSLALCLLPSAAFAFTTDSRGCYRCTINCTEQGYDYGQLICPKRHVEIDAPTTVYNRPTLSSVSGIHVKPLIKSLERRQAAQPESVYLEKLGRTKLAQPRLMLSRGQRQLTSYLREQMRGVSFTEDGKQYTVPRNEQYTAVEVMRVEDGETIEVRFPNGDMASIALAGIETPSRRNEMKPVPCYGKEAAGRLMRVLARKPVTLEDVPYLSFDRLGRIVKYVYLGSEDIGAAMIRDGFAFSDPQYPHPNAGYYDDLEAEARMQKRGLWGVQCSYYQEYQLR